MQQLILWYCNVDLLYLLNNTNTSLYLVITETSDVESPPSSLIISLLPLLHFHSYIYMVQICILIHPIKTWHITINNLSSNNKLTCHDAHSVQLLFSVHICVRSSTLTSTWWEHPSYPGCPACSVCCTLSVPSCVHSLTIYASLFLMLSNASSDLIDHYNMQTLSSVKYKQCIHAIHTTHCIKNSGTQKTTWESYKHYANVGKCCYWFTDINKLAKCV